ncbi:MAG: sulfur oxidation c-type cytochrome SoxA [Candidatus Marinarcus sp.]|uniref:sulfur oxidation c-type cytochrome SoxA n=1 Tax=Candidatus Marinarcus sp. TaxID=3100987 RepID=UPI003AFF6FAD
MLSKIVKAVALVALTSCALNAGDYNAQAEKDRLALVKYIEAKFKDPVKNQAQFFPYTTKEELATDYAKNLKFDDFNLGSYAFAKDAKEQYEAIKEMPPYEDAIDEGEALYHKKFANGNSFETCFPDVTISGEYPKFDEKRKAVISITSAINECLVANGEKAWNTKKGHMASLEAYFASQTTEAGKKMDIKIPSKEAANAYEAGKQYYYSQRGYLKLSCASCHIQGAGQRVRNEKLSPLLGQVTQFPVHRLKWGSLGTLERRISGCIVDEGQVPPKDNSEEMHNLLYFLAYMSNGMAVDGPDIRK